MTTAVGMHRPGSGESDNTIGRQPLLQVLMPTGSRCAGQTRCVTFVTSGRLGIMHTQCKGYLRATDDHRPVGRTPGPCSTWRIQMLTQYYPPACRRMLSTMKLITSATFRNQGLPSADYSPTPTIPRCGPLSSPGHSPHCQLFDTDDRSHDPQPRRRRLRVIPDHEYEDHLSGDTHTARCRRDPVDRLLTRAIRRSPPGPSGGTGSAVGQTRLPTADPES